VAAYAGLSMKITKEDFESWRDNIVTEEVFRAFDKLGQRARDQWFAASWGKGICDPVLLADLRARAEVVEDFRMMTFATLEEALNDEHERSVSDRIQDSGRAQES
jgi:hypothetical protein